MAQPQFCDHCGAPDPDFIVTNLAAGETMNLCVGGLFDFTEQLASAIGALAETAPAPQLADDTDRATLPEAAPSATQEAQEGPGDLSGEDRAWEASAGRKTAPGGRKSKAPPQEGNGATASPDAAAADVSG